MALNPYKSKWPLKPLSAVAEINPKRPTELRKFNDATQVSFVPMAAVCEKRGAIKELITRPFGEVKKGFTYFADGDVIFAKITPCMQNGKSAVASGLVNGLGFGSTEFHVLRPTKAEADWIYFFVRSQAFREEAARHFQGSAGQQRVPEDFLHNALIPDAPPKDQIRIVAQIKDYLGRVDEMQGLRQESLLNAKAFFNCFIREKYESLCRDFVTRPLGDLVKPTGGGTPSRKITTYWNGSIPWVSPKDMKRWEIDSAQESITQAALENSAATLIQPPAVLFVVRGMILIHTLPVAVSRVPLTINQDMKALIPKAQVSAEFIAFMLRGAALHLLNQVEVAGHGTRRLQTEKWIELPIPIVGKKEADLLEEFEHVRACAINLVENLQIDEEAALRESIFREAFAGNL